MPTTLYNFYIADLQFCLATDPHPPITAADWPCYRFGDKVTHNLSFPSGTIAKGDVLWLGLDCDMLSGGCHGSMAHIAHTVMQDEATNQAVTLTLDTRWQKFLGEVNGKQKPIPCILGLYIKTADAYITLAETQATAKPVVIQPGDADVELPEAIYYTKDEINAVMQRFEEETGDAIIAKEAAELAAEGAANSATEAESYAHGGTGTREGENDDNAMKYKQQAGEAKADAETARDDAIKITEGTPQQVQPYGLQKSAKGHANDAKEDATKAESYTHGGTGTREGEDDDNAMKYKQQAGEAKADAETARDDAIKITEGTPQQVQPYGLQKSAKGHANDAKEDAIKTAFDRSQVEALIATISQATLGPCTNIGVVHSANAKQISWTDPADLYIGTSQSPFVKWKKTELWRREGNVWPEYPGAPGCVKVAETAMGGEHVRDEYSTTAFVDSGLTEGQTYAYALFSYSTAGAVTVSPANQIPVSDVWTWPLVHYFSQAGTLLNYMPIGSVMTFTHADFDNTKLDGVQLDGIAARLMDYDGVRAWDAALFPHCAVWQTIDCLYSASHSWGTSAFDAAEQQYALTEDTVAIAGKVYYTNDGTTYTALVEGTDWDAGDPIPAASWFEKNPNPNYNYGLSRDTQSNAFQYLNLDAPAGNMVKKNLWESDLAYNSRPGFLYHLEQGLKNVLVPVRRTVALRTIYGHDETYKAKIFLPSRYEVFGTVNNGVAEGVRRWKWYGDRAADASSRVKLLNGSATYWWLSSPRTGSYNEYGVDTSGAENYYNPTNAYGLAPAYAV